MDLTRHSESLEAIIPGVVGAYESLKTKNGMGIYTSNGQFYNHTFFGRDSAMSAKFVSDFEHTVAREAIHALAALQGSEVNAKTQEEPGRIHHEFRDFATWKGSFLEGLVLRFYRGKWGGNSKELLSYFSTDTTALYIRLVAKFANHIDESILDTKVTNRKNETTTVRDSLTKAADWIAEQVDERGHFVTKRPNDWALPYQTFQDGPTAFARPDGSLANFKKGITYLESQVFGLDALEEVTQLLSDAPRRHQWQQAAHTLRTATMKDFWSENENFFGSSFDKNGLVDMPNISSAWTLNTALWEEIDEDVRANRVSAIVSRLFSEDFLTPVGLRTRALHTPQPLEGVVEYHGRLTVWPMFTFMAIEGLRHQGLMKLAEQLEDRLINGLNANGKFEEFLVVDGGGHLLRSVPGKKAEVSVDSQMLPEENIAFTVVPALTLAWRAVNRNRAWPKQADWQKKLEETILASIDNVERLEPSKAKDVVPAVVPTKFRRVRGNLRTGWYFMRERRKM